METYEELRRKMIDACGVEETDRIAKMAEDTVNERIKESKCPALRQMILMLENGSFGIFPTSEEKVSAMDNGFIQSCIEMNELGLANNFLQNVYKMSFSEAIEHVAKVMKKTVEIK